MTAQRRNCRSDEVRRLLLASLRAGHAPGERFLTVRAITRRHDVSMQTAQNLMKRLRADGVIEHRPHGVSYVKRIPSRTPPYRIVVLVPRHAGWFRERFLDGFAAGFGARVPAGSLVELESSLVSSVECVERVAGLDPDGVIGVAHGYGWPFYALHRLGVPVLADLASSEWPGMPVTSVEFPATAGAAGVMLRRHGHRRASVVGSHHAGADFAAFKAGLAGEGAALVADIYSPEATQHLCEHLHTHKPTALYMADNSVLPTVLSVLASEGLRVPEDVSLVMHDSNREPYEGFAVPPIASVGPSIQEIGKALAERMCRMLDGSGAKEPALQYLKPVVRVTASVRRV